MQPISCADIIQFPTQRGGRHTPKNAWASVRDDYTRYLITQGRTPDTIRTYVSNAAFFAGWMKAHNLPLISASSKHLELYVATQLEMVARSTAMNRLLACRSFYRYLVADRQRTTDPTANIPVKRDKLVSRRPFSEAEMASLVEKCWHGETAHRWPAILPATLLLIGGAMRRSELIRINATHFDWDRGRILINGKGSKQRWVAPGQTALKVLSEYVRMTPGADKKLWPFSGHQLYKLLRDVGKEASVVNVYPHRFRITFAVSFLRRYGNLMALKQILGHENLRTTELYAGYGISEGALEMQSQFDLAQRYTAPLDKL